jgi:hypothetical protein
MAKAKSEVTAAQLHDALADDIYEILHNQGDPSRVCSVIMNRIAREPRLTPPAGAAEANAALEGGDAPVLPGE